MTTNQQQEPPLSTDQRALVQQHLGLIAVHLRRRVPGLSQPRREREWDDLFQEGFLGLVRAARQFEPERGIPFAAFALSRIHAAVDRAIKTRFSIVSVPVRAQREQRRSSGSTWPQCVSLQEAADNGRPLAIAAQERPARENDELETIGCRLRDKYERAVQEAVRQLRKGKRVRSDYVRLVGMLVDKRLLMPDDHRHPSLREIARATGSSYGRVAGCNRKLITLIRHQLEQDPEFEALEQVRRQSALGVHQPIDHHTESALQEACQEAFLRHVRSSDKARMGRVLHALLEWLPRPTDSFIRDCMQRLSPNLRESLINDCVA